MLEEKISQILAGRVSSVCESTEEEKKLFRDKTKGGFFTFSLSSGQKFVAYFSKNEDKRKMIFRPLNKLIEGLKEFSWKTHEGIILYANSEFDIKFFDGVSEKEKDNIKEFLSPSNRLSSDICYPYPLLEKAISVSDAYFNCVQAKEILLKKLIIKKTGKYI